MSLIVTSKEGPLGDTLVTFPAICELARVHGEIYFAGNHYWSGTHSYNIYRDLLPKHYKILPMHELPAGDHKSISFHIGEIRGNLGHLQMTKACWMWAGLPDPGVDYLPIEIDYQVTDEQPVYDIVCCAMNNGNQLTGERQWPQPHWQSLINKLRADRYSICMLGTTENGNPYTDVEYYYDHSHKDVAGVIRKARLCITIDTGISHIAHAVNAKTVLIHSSAANVGWSGYPSTERRTTLHGWPPNIPVEHVYEAAKRLL